MAKADIDIAALLLAARERAGLSQEPLATRMKVTKAEVAHIEGGHTRSTWKVIER
jgi:transcriptional regulator with XRE-family HTH domain